MFDRLNILYAHIHQGLLSWMPPYLAEMGEILDSWFSHNALPEIALPLITCQAVDGNPEEPKIMRAAVAILSSLVGLQILDDMRLKNNRHALWLRVGAERAIHYAYAFQALADQLWIQLVRVGDVAESVFQTSHQGVMIALAGRNRALSHDNRSWEAYWKTAEMVSALPSGHWAACGAMLAMAEDSTIEACRIFGHHLGLARHLVEEYQRMWGPGVHYQIRRRDLSLPILYGLKCDHPDQAELAELIQQDRLALHEQRVMEILKAIDAKSYLIWAALQERKRALEAIKLCPSEEGKQVLETFLLSLFEPIPAFARADEFNLSDEKKVQVPQQKFDPNELSSGLPSLSYRSVGLGLRHQIRQTPFNLISSL